MAATDPESHLQRAALLARAGQTAEMREHLWFVVTHPEAASGDLSDAIAIAAGSDQPEIAIEILDYLENHLRLKNPSDFSREEISARLKTGVKSEMTFEGTGMFGRGRPFWPLHVIKRIEISPSEFLVQRNLYFMIPQTIKLGWNEIDRVVVSSQLGWRYRQRVKIRTCSFFSKEKPLLIDVSNDFPDIEKPLDFLDAIEMQCKVIYENT
ncbi:MAG: hypothetical protein AB7P37_22825 [Ramlibacter sp.]